MLDEFGANQQWTNGQDPPENADPADSTDGVLSELRTAISNPNFTEWYEERQFADNIKQGQAYFNGPGRIKPPDQQSPSKLLQCRRKTIYKQLKAPEETEDPRGIFWMGSKIEEDLIVPFLEDLITGRDAYITNSLWVNYTVETDAGNVRIKGSTDPVIVDSDAEPILLTEIKSKDSLDQLNEPNDHHLAQALAYLIGLNAKYEREVESAVIVYVGRTTLDLKAFTVEFDQEFWQERVRPWLGDIKAYRLEEELPPAEPEFEWECTYCSYRERCGKGDREFEDIRPSGFLPLFEYPKHKVEAYLEIHDNAVLTPTLAHQYPELSERYPVTDWECRGCHETFDWNESRFDGRESFPIKCPRCAENGSIRYLRGARQPTQIGGKDG